MKNAVVPIKNLFMRLSGSDSLEIPYSKTEPTNELLGGFYPDTS